MNWNAVIKSLQEEAKNCARRVQTNTNPYFNTQHETLKMEIYIDLAKALAEGMKETFKPDYVKDAWPEN